MPLHGNIIWVEWFSSIVMALHKTSIMLFKLLAMTEQPPFLITLCATLGELPLVIMATCIWQWTKICVVSEAYHLGLKIKFCLFLFMPIHLPTEYFLFISGVGTEVASLDVILWKYLILLCQSPSIPLSLLIDLLSSSSKILYVPWQPSWDYSPDLFFAHKTRKCSLAAHCRDLFTIDKRLWLRQDIEVRVIRSRYFIVSCFKNVLPLLFLILFIQLLFW